MFKWLKKKDKKNDFDKINDALDYAAIKAENIGLNQVASWLYIIRGNMFCPEEAEVFQKILDEYFRPGLQQRLEGYRENLKSNIISIVKE